MAIENEPIHADIDRIVSELGRSGSAVIPILHAIQRRYNYLPEAALRRVCEITDITPASIAGVSTFYSQFRHTPTGRHLVRVCDGTACHLKGSPLVYDALLRELRIDGNRDTDPDGLFTVQKVACLGCCTLAPVVQIDDVVYGHVTGSGVPKILRDFLSGRDRISDRGADAGSIPEGAGEIRIGLDSCCVASGCGAVRDELERCIAETGVGVKIKRVGCVGMCHRAPLLEIVLPGHEPVLYEKVRPGEVRRILLGHFKPRSVIKRLENSAADVLDAILDGGSPDRFSRHPLTVRDSQIASFFGRQVHVATEHFGQADPLDIGEYRSGGGFRALERCLAELAPGEIVETVTASGLRGRGGAGFPSGRKWDIVRRVRDEEKYIICNGDEGDPGAFMDRMILESHPFRVIEGMIIAARAVGAHEGFLYIRAEYPLAVERVKNALAQCEAHGLLGGDILGSGFSLALSVREGAGAFVCGEETALIASLEGRRGTPRFRPPYPARDGLRGHPTLVNNCETFAAVPWIMRNGAGAFSRLGTGRSRGTKVFSLAGKVSRGGLIEVPMGITIRDIVEEIGGGVEAGKRFKAVLVGGPSGGCIPAEMADTKIDYEDLTDAGAMMGSGGLLVLDDSDCMVDIARYFLDFTCGQSCGKCTWCRIGVRHMLTILEQLCMGGGEHSDLVKLEELAHKTKRGSLCGLGKTAPNPVLTTLRYFRDEYEAHVNGTCPAKRCRGLVSYSIGEKCIGCTICAQKCPAKAIPVTPYEKHAIDQTLCIRCGTCGQVCPAGAVEVA